MKTIAFLIDREKNESIGRNIDVNEPIDFYTAKEWIMENMVEECTNCFYLIQVETTDTEKEVVA